MVRALKTSVEIIYGVFICLHFENSATLIKILLQSNNNIKHKRIYWIMVMCMVLGNKHRSVLAEDNQRTRDYLDTRGQRITSANEIKLEGDLLAVVDSTCGGFYASITSGYYSVEKARNITLYDESLKEIDSVEGNITGISLNLPKKRYFAIISEDLSLDPTSEWWSEYPAHNRTMIGKGTLDNGVYRVTSPDLIESIKEVLSDPEKKIEN